MDTGSSVTRLRKAMSAIWQETFGDDADYVDRYLENYDADDNRIVICKQDEVVAFLHYHRFDTGDFTASYIFGVVTVPHYRGSGIARGMISGAMKCMNQHGDIFAMLIAEEESLRSWYATMGFAALSETPVRVSGSDGLSFDNDDTNLNIALYRIVNVERYLELYVSRHAEACFDVMFIDDMIPANNACYSVARGRVQVSDWNCDNYHRMSPGELLLTYPIECNVSEIIIPTSSSSQ